MAPDFIIAGAPKSGTTALFTYLREHPSIFMPPNKEPHYFASDLTIAAQVRSLDTYLALFAGAHDGALTGEASVMYLYSNVAIAQAIAHNPRTKIVAVLRHPQEAARSLHAARWAYGHENIEDFEKAWNAQEERLAGRRMPPNWPDARTLQYGPIFRYADQVRRMMRLVPESQRHIVLYEEFFADPQVHFHSLLAFLGAPRMERAAFPVVNGAATHRSRFIAQALWRSSRSVKLLPLRAVARSFGVGSAIRSWNTVHQPKPPLRSVFCEELNHYFADDIAELEYLLGRPLWRPNRETQSQSDG